MNISPTDWVWFTHNDHTQFGEFSYLPTQLQNDINLAFNSSTFIWNMRNVNKGITLHMVLPNEGKKYFEKIHFLFKDANKPNFDITRLPNGNHWVNGESPKFGSYIGLNQIIGFEGRKRRCLSYLDWLYPYIKDPGPTPTFKESKVNNYWEKHDNEIKQLLQYLKNKQKLEEKPMKVKQFLVEIHEYNREKKQITDQRNVILLQYADGRPVSPTSIHNLVNSLYVNTNDDFDFNQEILHIQDKLYKITSGHVEFSQERLDMLSNKKGPLVTINMTKPLVYDFYFEEEREIKGKEKTIRGTEFIYLPKSADVQKVLKFYQKKFLKKNYSIDNKSIKKELSEKSQELQNLPTKGETPGRELRKVCYKPVGGVKVFRGPYAEVKKFVESGNYEFVPKKEWKSQRLNKDGEVVAQGHGYKTNINKSPTGRKLGERRETHESKSVERQLKIIRSERDRHLRQYKIKPTEEERASQSEKDKKKYIEKCKSSKKVYTPQRVYRAFEAVILGEKSKVLGTLRIKAKSDDHAKKILAVIMKNKGKDAKLTGNVREWVKETGKNRPRKPAMKKAGTNKPRKKREDQEDFGPQS